MKKLLLLLLAVFALSTNAQEIKKTDYIVESMTGLRMGVTTVKENGEILRKEYFSYMPTTNQFDEGMTIAQSNNADDFLKQLEKLKELILKLEKGESINLDLNRTVKKDTILGVKVLWISGDGQAGVAQLNEGQINKLIDKLNKWTIKQQKN
ncbi:hypothetical protein [Flavobacterium sp.]|uniref:hypothetical protein n=1 Tax=Flavobacterium sp. TaxID=239 RepID=UPI0025E5994E|nr:hypothetical protein [Flavobacterium sp.]